MLHDWDIYLQQQICGQSRKIIDICSILNRESSLKESVYVRELHLSSPEW